MNMRFGIVLTVVLAAVWLTTASATTSGPIKNWLPTAGLTEEDAALKVEAAIAEELATVDEGDTCSVEEIWSLERDNHLKPTAPRHGEVVAISAYALGPYNGCSESRRYDCRVLLRKVGENANPWRAAHTYCEPVGSGLDE